MLKNFLEEIIVNKTNKVKQRKKNKTESFLLSQIDSTLPNKSFLEALKKSGMSIIAEVKKSSPSKGIIREDFNPVQIALDYQEGGAAALSILTEEDFFLGSDDYLKNISSRVDIPTLRKDFIIDSYQITEAKLLGASAYLLIVACLDKSQLRDLIQVGENLSIMPLIEVHDQKELDVVLNLECPLVGINNRNLKTFKTSLETTYNLFSIIPSTTTVVSESGIYEREQIQQLEKLGINAALIGESLMRESSPKDALKRLLGTL